MSSLSASRRHLVRLGTTLGLLGVLASGAHAQAKPDHVLWRNARGQVNTIVGKVTENSLAQVAIETGSGQRTLEAPAVASVEFGDVPAAFADAVTYGNRGDFANAAAKYTLAAGDGSARAVVRARARLRAAESWLQASRGDRAALESGQKECAQFLSEFPENREVPAARLLLGRLQRLAGDAAAAAETGATLFRDAADKPGYPPLVSFQAGLAAGEAYLAAKDATRARETYLALESALSATLAGLAENDPLRASYVAIQAEARLGEGFCLLAAGSLSQAKTFFQGQLAAAAEDPVKRFGARLGIGEILRAEGAHRAAQLEFAQVSAIDHTNRDRRARALVGLAASALELQAKNDAKLWLEAVRTRFGDTPAALEVQELEKKL